MTHIISVLPFTHSKTNIVSPSHTHTHTACTHTARTYTHTHTHKHIHTLFSLQLPLITYSSSHHSNNSHSIASSALLPSKSGTPRTHYTSTPQTPPLRSCLSSCHCGSWDSSCSSCSHSRSTQIYSMIEAFPLRSKWYSTARWASRCHRHRTAAVAASTASSE
jgi:hypothetical protein